MKQAFRIAAVLASTETVLPHLKTLLWPALALLWQTPTPHLTEASMRSPRLIMKRPEPRQLLES